MTEPVVVQGTAVQTPAFGTSTQLSNQGSGPVHEPSGSGCKDPIFALLFYVNLIAIVAVAATYGPDAFGEDAAHDYDGFIYAAVISAVLSLGFACVGLVVLMAIPELMLKVSLIFVVVMAGAWAIMAIASGAMIAGIFGLIFFAIAVCYARAAWPRIPFAAVNMTTGITAVRANFGVATFALFFSLLAVGWSLLWAVAFAGVFEQTCSADEEKNNCNDPNYGLLFVLFVSYFFTHQVLQNSVHVTVSGVVGNWWVAPSENGFCGRAVFNSFIRTMTTSFGSICFGSLLVAIIRALKMLAETARANDDAGIGACIAECILSCLASMLEYFNKWAFVYVGVYGYGYLEAGKNVFTLFQNRGWEAIIADDLVGNALLLVSLIVGGVMGAVALIFTKASDWFDAAGDSDKAMAFLLGFVIGFAVCSVLLSTIASAVNTVIVMFADAPAELQRNYPDISQKMRQTWSEIYPGSI